MHSPFHLDLKFTLLELQNEELALSEEVADMEMLVRISEKEYNTKAMDKLK
jgi:hypothetical protein